MARASPDRIIALWAVNFAHPVRDAEAWLALLDERMREAKAAGAELFLLPEYVSAHWLAAGKGIAPTKVIPRMAEIGARLLPNLEALAIRHDMALIAGSMPVARRGAAACRNRAWVLLPDGRGGIERRHHDKVALTPSEQDRAGWRLAAGGRVAIFTWRGLRFAVLICLDVEMPHLAARLVARDLDLLLVPSMTAQVSGYRRVFDCAKARAIELFAAIAAVGGIGGAGSLWGAEANCSGAAIFLPCEMALGGGGGLLAGIGPFARIEGPGPLLTGAVPIAALRALRRSGAEVWQGSRPVPAVRITAGA